MEEIKKNIESLKDNVSWLVPEGYIKTCDCKPIVKSHPFSCCINLIESREFVRYYCPVCGDQIKKEEVSLN